MTVEKFKTYVVDFIKQLFSASNEVSSKRLLAFYFAVVVTFLMFFHYDISYVINTMMIIGALLGYTTIEKFKKDSNDNK